MREQWQERLFIHGLCQSLKHQLNSEVQMGAHFYPFHQTVDNTSFLTPQHPKITSTMVNFLQVSDNATLHNNPFLTKTCSITINKALNIAAVLMN